MIFIIRALSHVRKQKEKGQIKKEKAPKKEKGQIKKEREGPKKERKREKGQCYYPFFSTLVL